MGHKNGARHGDGKYIAVIDGDGQFPLKSLVSCLIKIEEERLDFVKTYRVRRDDGLYRRTISVVFSKVFRLFFNMDIKDVNSKPKIILRSKYQLMKLESNDWFVDTEMMLQAKEANLAIGKIPIHFYNISGRASFVKPSAILEFLRNLFHYQFQCKKLADKPPIHEPGNQINMM